MNINNREIKIVNFNPLISLAQYMKSSIKSLPKHILEKQNVLICSSTESVNDPGTTVPINLMWLYLQRGMLHCPRMFSLLSSMREFRSLPFQYVMSAD